MPSFHFPSSSHPPHCLDIPSRSQEFVYGLYPKHTGRACSVHLLVEESGLFSLVVLVSLRGADTGMSTLEWPEGLGLPLELEAIGTDNMSFGGETSFLDILSLCNDGRSGISV